MNKTTPRGASANNKKQKGAEEAQRRLFHAPANNDNTKESVPSDSNNNAGASVVLADDDNSVFNSGSMATVSQVDIIEVNSLLTPISAGAMSQVSGEVLGGYELQPINPSNPLDEGDEETPVKVTSLVSLIVDLISNLKLFFPSPTLEATSL